jgi:hypothetical protein
MSVLPVYDVEFIPLERRLADRRVAPSDAPLPPNLTADRRKAESRRREEYAELPAPPKANSN